MGHALDLVNCFNGFFYVVLDIGEGFFQCLIGFLGFELVWDNTYVIPRACFMPSLVGYGGVLWVCMPYYLKLELLGKGLTFGLSVMYYRAVIRFDSRKVDKMVMWKLHYLFIVCHILINPLLNVCLALLPILPSKVISGVSEIN